MKLNGSEILAQVFIENKVDTVFGYPGGAVLNIYDALYKYRDKITHYMTAHEQGAAHAADGYARATGKTGVVIATSGPGATNLVTGIATAYMDSIPMVAITGNVGNSLIGRDSFQEVYIAGITMPITKHNFVVRRVEDLADTLRAAFKIASSGRPGPVLVDIPKDVTAAVCEYTPKEPTVTEHAQKEYDLSEIAKVINSAKKPVVFAGGGVKISKAEKALLKFIQKADIPYVHTIMAAGAVRYDEPLNYGILGMHGQVHANKAVDRADVVIAVGTRFSDRVALNTNAFAQRAKIIQIDIDKSEINKNVAVDYSICGDVNVALELLLPLIKETKHTEWIEKINSWVMTYPESNDNKLTPKKVIEAINASAGEEGIFVTDVGQHQMWAAQYLHHVKADHFLTSGGLGTMGYGYGAAIGAAIGTGAKHVYHITGDGSFHMNMNEACTAVSYNVPVISIIMNNAVLGMVRQWQATFYGRRFSSSEPERVTDYKKVIEGFGGKGFICTTVDELADALEKAKQETGPVWIDCRIDREEKVLPMIPSGKTVNDIITE
ncbi:MAG: biosynthetic-type acetolactate synthase large subunit [Acutalibacteraceae bacterium]|nr:biosynthetic-type acetolactate synthase large subunit [Acutalibacteraceae bacterium]